MAFLSLIKSKIWIFVSVIVAALAGALKIEGMRRKSAEKRADRAENQLNYNTNIGNIEDQIEEDITSRRVEARKEIESGKVPRNLRDPDDW